MIPGTKNILNSKSLKIWHRFVDPVDWADAMEKFPEAPWLYYVKPAGQNNPEQWEGFRQAVYLLSEKARRAREEKKIEITLDDILTVNALIQFGCAFHKQAVLRNNQPIFNYRSSDEIKRVYQKGSIYYQNDDGLCLRVDGFWPASMKSIDFFAACRQLGSISYTEAPDQWESAYAHFKAMLYPEINDTHDTWQVYFITRQKDLLEQMEKILNWFHRAVCSLGQDSIDGSFQDKAAVLSVKMQRYIDICQFCMDGSGRTSKLIQDYIVQSLGLLLPQPVLYEAYGRFWENGTYLPLDEAVQMYQSGWDKERINGEVNAAK